MKVLQSLLSYCKLALAKNGHKVLARDSLPELDVVNASKAVILVGDRRSGKSVFLADNIANKMYPWWHRLFFPVRGVYLNGCEAFRSSTIDSWLRNQIGPTEKPDPFYGLWDLVREWRRGQRVRQFLHEVFNANLPSFLLPQPVFIVVDDAEGLLCVHRAACLSAFHQLIREAKDNDLIRLVFIVNTENAVKSMQLVGSEMYDVFKVPGVSEKAVAEQFGDEFAKNFVDCDSSIGITLDYDREASKDMTAKAYSQMRKENFRELSMLSLKTVISEEEYRKARERTKN